MGEIKRTQAEELEQLKKTLEEWQQVEDHSIDHCDAILARTQNPLIRLVIEILRQDSMTHRRVQQAILDSLEKEAFSLGPEELGELWRLIEQHDEAEERALRMAEEARQHCPLLIQRQLLEYLIDDERKHERLLGYLNDFKRSIYRSA